MLVLEGVGDFLDVPTFGSDNFGVVRGKVMRGIELRAIEDSENGHGLVVHEFDVVLTEVFNVLFQCDAI